MSKSLAEIGLEMRAKADIDGTAYRGLGSGLHLHLSHSGGLYSLVLWRSQTLPSQGEIETVLTDWRIPLDAEVSAPTELVWVNGRSLDDATCRVVSWGGPRQVVAESPGASYTDPEDRSHLRARPSACLGTGGVFGKPWSAAPVALRTPTDPTHDLWVASVERRLQLAERDGDQARARHFRQVLANCREAGTQEAA